MKKSPYTLPSTTVRDTLIGIGIGAVALAVVILGIVNMGSGVVGNTITGTISAKRFTPHAQEQLTIRRGVEGVHTKHIEGDYLLDIRAEGHTYTVAVDKKTYDGRKEGDRFTFPRPRD